MGKISKSDKISMENLKMRKDGLLNFYWISI